MKNISTKKISIVLIIYAVIFSFIGGSLAYLNWETSSNQSTMIEFTLNRDFSCAADVGGNISPSNVPLAPADCTSSAHAIKRELIVKPTLFGELDVFMDLWLDINSIAPELAATSNFKYSLTTNPNSCTNGVVSSGTFNGKTVGDTVPLLAQKEYMETMTDTYYLYVWLDAAETNPNTMNKSFDFSINGNCENTEKTTYAVYSETDNSLRFYKTENPITEANEDGSIASPMANKLIDDETGIENTKVYTDIENTIYNSESQVPWYEYNDSIKSVYIEDKLSPISLKNWFYDMKNVTYMDLSKLDTSRITDMSAVFNSVGKNSTTFQIIGLDNWNVSNVTNMSSMFQSAGYDAATFDIGNLGNWDVSNVTNMFYIFSAAGTNASAWNIGDISNWNVSNVTNMFGMFRDAGKNSDSFDIGDISNWNVSNVTAMTFMFSGAGAVATTWNVGNLSNWDVSNVTNMGNMFQSAGNNATTFDIGNLGNWDVSNVTDMGAMFSDAGGNATTWNIGDISNWNVSNVTNMSSMFRSAGYNAEIFEIVGLNNWDVSNVTNMSYMFQSAGYNATTFDIGNLGNWNVSNVTNMFYMFSGAGRNATTWNIGDISNWNVSNVTNMFGMFRDIGKNSDSFDIGDISNWNVSNVTDMSVMFSGAGNSGTNWSLDLSKWNVDKVITYSGFDFGVENKITPPLWVN